MKDIEIADADKAYREQPDWLQRMCKLLGVDSGTPPEKIAAILEERLRDRPQRTRVEVKPDPFAVCFLLSKNDAGWFWATEANPMVEHGPHRSIDEAAASFTEAVNVSMRAAVYRVMRKYEARR